MKCSNCGLPLTPNNTYRNCPRCLLPLVAGPEPALNHSLQSYANQAPGQERGAQAFAWSQGHDQPAFPPVAAAPFPQSGQLRQPAPTSPQLSTPEPMAAHAYSGSAPYMTPAHPTGAMYSAAGASQRPNTSNRGFIAAGLCVFAGALILVFVYFMALGLPSTPPTNTTFNGTAITATPNNAVTTPTTVAPTPTLVPSPTMTGNPGAQYIDNPQMASAVNFNTAQPLQTTTTFKANHKVYVTFNLPAGKNGAVCLYWYLNTKYIAQYPFAVTPNDKAGYSYAIYGGSGPAYVDIYWASTTACSDKILAQHVNFTVTA